MQTLDERYTPIGGLPKTVKKLYKLERLHINFNNDANRMWKLPQGLRKMKELREVASPSSQTTSRLQEMWVN
uniref:Uncharacterized protein n=1 Tax=Arundo donax TaxID=35708 RepID=A0A0A9ANZ2_ARUDO